MQEFIARFVREGEPTEATADGSAERAEFVVVGRVDAVDGFDLDTEVGLSVRRRWAAPRSRRTTPPRASPPPP
jgi:hypothetical protein